ncbi:uncharacterized protein DUF2789 [Azomonas agilis]|uniref:Uncharacterized protein DUF2789 n=1 Tax=Azomonas agilis TaxID=116849 RepID=A0A562IL86_9GAMM|nr:DUF2789 domain-containing protein [Azomonas agilis]TWH71453.1 uncharacterized protein DUF2789 [Azomonas agilis]
MQAPVHDLSLLFEQLGLKSDSASINTFITSHSLPDHVVVNEAPFWNSAQASMLKEALQFDADWALLVDQLNERLHTQH